MSIKNVYPNSDPELSLDFVNGRRIDPKFEFSRASTGTYIDANGIIRTARIGEPRFDFDPVTGECKGLLIEESKTNFINHSVLLNSSRSGGANASYTYENLLSPSGNIEPVFKLTVTTNAYSYGVWNPSSIARSQRFISVWIKKGNRDSINLTNNNNNLIWNFNTESFSGNGISLRTPTVTKFPNGWYRVSWKIVNSLPVNDVLIGYQSGIINDYFYMWGMQFEDSSVSSYIPTSGSTVTRVADQLVLNNAPIQSEGTFYIESKETKGISLVADNGSNYLLIDQPTNQYTKSVLYYNTNKILKLSSNTSNPEEFNFLSALTLDLNRISLGFDRLNNTGYINGHLKKFSYHSNLLTEDSLRSLTNNKFSISRYEGMFTLGGTITEITQNDIVYKVHTFTTVDESYFITSTSLDIEYLIVAGGGAGGSDIDRSAGGGGGGGLLKNTPETRLTISPGQYKIIVGRGGIVFREYGATPFTGGNGENSFAFGLTAFGGGGGAASRFFVTSPGNGGSGGGGGAGAVGTGISGQGNNGGSGIYQQGGSFGSAGGGGGGYLEPGGNASLSDTAGNGGAGIVLDITGTPIAYAGGGGGGGGSTGGGSNGIGGGSTSNRGGGGAAKNAGGSGIVIIRYIVP